MKLTVATSFPAPERWAADQPEPRLPEDDIVYRITKKGRAHMIDTPNARMWRYGWPEVDICYMAWPGKLVWFFISDRGCNQGMYCQRTLGLDGVE